LFARRRTWHSASSPRQQVGSYRTVGKARTGDGLRFWAEPVGALLAGDLLRSGSKPGKPGKPVLPDTPRRLVSGPLRAPSLPSLPPKAPTPAAEAELREAILRQKRNCPRPSCGRSGNARGHPVGANLFARRRTWHSASSPRQQVGSYRSVGNKLAPTGPLAKLALVTAFDSGRSP